MQIHHELQNADFDHWKEGKDGWFIYRRYEEWLASTEPNSTSEKAHRATCLDLLP